MVIFGAMANAAVGETSIRANSVVSVGMYAVLYLFVKIAGKLNKIATL
jgi:hypothetical protein